MKLLPLFPLPDVVLFPGPLLPLHIFEPRYRRMVADALDDDHRLGMVLLRPGWEPVYDERPPIYTVGCSGVIVHAALLEDGRYNIVLRGLERFRIVDEDHTRAYRRATVEPWPDPDLEEGDQSVLSGLRAALEATLGLPTGPVGPAGPVGPGVLTSMPDADLVHTLAHALDLEPVEKQALLERENLCLRAQSLVELLEMKRILATMPDAPRLPH